jgi:ankyrin repeat protein
MLDVNATKVDGSTALLVACRNSRLEVVCELLKNKEVDVNSKTVAGITISPSAGRHGHIDVLLALRKYENADASA